MGEDLDFTNCTITEPMTSQDVKLMFKTEKFFIIGYRSFDTIPMMPFVVNMSRLLTKINQLQDGTYFCQGYNDRQDRDDVFEVMKMSDLECNPYSTVEMN